MKRLAALLAACLLGPSASAQWAAQASGTKAVLRGLSVVSGEVAWASGAGGTFLVTRDGGTTWRGGSVPGGSALDFRDVHALGAETAYLLAIGPGDRSRVYKTSDGGATWAPSYTNADPKGFLDALAFRDADHGLVLGDPVEGRFVVLTTDDGGTTWGRVAPGPMPAAWPGEGAFAASGTCLAIGEGGRAWFGTGGARAARVFRSDDRGRTWSARETPIVAGTASAGVFSLAFHDADRGVAVGGDYKAPARAGDVVALTDDGGRTWRRPGGPGPGGYRSAVAYAPGSRGRVLVAVGPNGSDVSTDGGETWRPLGTDGFHAVGLASPSAGWAVGDDGRVAKWDGRGPDRL